MSEVQKRVEALRQAKKAEEDAAENKRKDELVKREDELIQWEAEMILALEEYTDVYIMEDLYEANEKNIDIHEYLYKLLAKIKGCWIFGFHSSIGDLTFKECIKLKGKSHRNSHGACRSYPTEDIIKRNVAVIESYLTNTNTYTEHSERHFKAKYLIQYVNNIKNSSEFIEYTKDVDEVGRLLKEDEEKRIANEKKHAEKIAKIKKEDDDRNKLLKNIDDTNNNIRNVLRGRGSILDTFTILTLTNLDLNSKKEFLSNSKVHKWAHYSVDMPTKTCSPCITGMPDYFSSYYEEGKVPFLTKCPMCNSPTKFNYLNHYYGVNGNCHNFRKANIFTSVYCDNHYVYHSDSNKHYIISEREGKEIIIVNHDTPDCRYVCWKPNGKWKEWNPSDPDGSKAATEKKQKEAEEIQKQIAELQAKLTVLQK